MLKKILYGLAILVVVGLVVAAGAALYLDKKYNVLWDAPVTEFAEVADETVSMVVLLKPPLAEALITDRVTAAAPDFPPWALNYVLPNEAAILMRPDLAQQQLGLTFFLNERRFGPVITQQGNAMGIQGSMPQIQWEPEGFVQERRGVITLRGSLPVNPLIANMAERDWGIVTPAGYPKPEGGHAAEIIVDNRNGGLFLLLGTLQSSGLAPMNLPPEELAKNLLPVGELRLTVDFESPNVAKIRLWVEAGLDATDGEFGGFDFTLSLLYGGLAKDLRDRNGIELEGSKKREGRVITGEYTLTGVEKILAGGRVP